MTDSDFKIHRIDGGPSLLKDVTGRAAGGKRAMVMAGGGLASAVFEIGCLRALDDLFGETSTTDFDIFVGVSAGAITATALACGITGDEMFKSLIGASQIIEPISRNNIFRFNWEEVIQKVAGLPRTYAHAMSRFVRSGKDLTLGEAILSLTEIFPTAPLNGAGIEEYIRNIFASAGRPNSFRALEKTLLIPAVNLDTGETRIFGKGDDLDVPISKAVQASAALPGFYRPVRIGNADYVDGAVNANLNIEAAVEAGAKLIVCVNPYIPIYNDPQKLSVPLVSGRGGHISQKGIIGVLDQVFRIMVHKKLEKDFVDLLRRHPDVDIITFQPARNEYRMFFYNIMRFSARIVLAEYGFVSTKKAVDSGYDGMSEVFARYGIELNPMLIDREYEQMRRSRFSLDSIVKTLGTVPILRKRRQNVA